MYLQFILNNIPEAEEREDVQRYLNLRSHAVEYGETDHHGKEIEEFLELKSKLFGEAMDNFLKSRGDLSPTK